MKEELIIAAYGSHNAAVAMFYKGNYTVIEVERWLSKKNAGLINYLPSAYPKIIFDEITDFLLAKTDRKDVDVYLTNYNDLNKLKPKFQFKKHINFDHHEAHAATGFYQSPYDEAITFTFDGGGDLGFFNVYKTSRREGIKLLEKFNQDLGFAYMILANYISDIRKDPLNIGNLVYAGKLMGLCSYGDVRQEWIPAFTEFYETFNYFGDSYIGGLEASRDALPKLMKAIGVEDFDFDNSRFEGQFSWDLAATTQYVFEEQFLKFAKPYFDKYPDMPVTLSGGCALNVILNARLLDMRNGKVFVPPNPNDCGVAAGGLLLYIKPEHQVDLTYAGTPILDEHMFSSYIENGNYTLVENVSVNNLARFIANGNIVGVINGDSEHGPRALGNRSILCNPVGDMKDVLNKKVKDREWYRPFAPLVRLEDAGKYFDFPEGAQSRHMTFVAKVKSEWREVIPAVTHEDGTGRIQTVTRNQNPFIYDLLTKFSEISNHSVLLNTSFNVNGKPILTRLSEALQLLTNTKMDAVYYNETLIFRKGEEEKYTREIVSENIKPLDDSTSTYLLVFPKSANELTTEYLPKLKEFQASLDKLIIICDEKYSQQIRRVLGENENLVYHPITQNMLYYHEMLMSKVDGLKLDARDFKDYVKLLWIKPIMHKNYHRTLNHLFVDVDKLISDSNIIKTIKMLTKLANDDGKLIVTGHQHKSAITKRVSGTIENETPDLKLVWGNLEQIEWLSVNFEGHLLALMREGIVGKDVDYIALTYNNNIDKFKVC